MKPKIELVTRADDAGSCRSANEAILEAVEAGVIKNVSFMAVGPEIEHAVELLGGRDDICYGLHLTLNAEWETVKWKPLTASTSLSDESGYFLPSPMATQAQIKHSVREEIEQNYHIPEPADIEGEFGWEVEAQLKRLQELDLNLSYVDEHVGFSRVDHYFRQAISRFCEYSQLIDAHPVATLPDIDPSGDLLFDLEKRLQTAMLNQYVWVTHPSKIAPDMERFYLPGGLSGVVARERDAERQLLTDPALPDLLIKWRVKLCRYDEITKRLK